MFGVLNTEKYNMYHTEDFFWRVVEIENIMKWGNHILPLIIQYL